MALVNSHGAPDRLRQLYLDQGLSYQRIAQDIGCSSTVVVNALAHVGLLDPPSRRPTMVTRAWLAKQCTVRNSTPRHIQGMWIVGPRTSPDGRAMGHPRLDGLRSPWHPTSTGSWSPRTDQTTSGSSAPSVPCQACRSLNEHSASQESDTTSCGSSA